MREEQGATMVEYSIMVALVAGFCFAAVQFLSSNLSAAFTNPILTGALGT